MARHPVLATVIICALLALAVGAGGALMLMGGEQDSRSGVTAPGRAEADNEVHTATPGAISSAPAPTLPQLPPRDGAVPPPPSETPASAPTDTVVPGPTSTPEKAGGPVTLPNNHTGRRWVTLQAGHWRAADLPEELAHLSLSTGASAGGVNEVDVNVAVAKLAAQRLAERGYNVDVLDAYVPPNYTSDLFLALHADGSDDPSIRGFKAVAPWGWSPASDGFVKLLYEEYGKATGLPTDARTSPAMANYYAFNPVKYRHSINPHVPAALLEMGFVTNPDDRAALANEQEKLAWGIANSVDRYFRSGLAGATPSPYPTFTPTRTPTRTTTPTGTTTPTPLPTATGTPTETPSPAPTIADEAILTLPEAGQQPPQTATSPTPTASRTPRLPTSTRTPPPTPTPLTGTLALDGRWLPPMSPNRRALPAEGGRAAPVLLSRASDDPNQESRLRGPSWRPFVWLQYYVPSLGRSIWIKGWAVPSKE